MSNIRILVGCEFSGIVTEAFLKRGHHAMSCDLLPSEKQVPHYQGDVRDVLNDGWDLAIFHPPCTYLTNSGVCWLHSKPGRWELMREAALFFKMLFNAPIPRIAVENPIMHKYAIEIIGRRQDQIIQPWMFGHTEQKATGLWLKNLPLLKETHNVKTEMLKLPKSESQRVHYASPGPDRWKVRSRTLQGVADAMATQWG